jgi:hypothetical protein
VGLCFRCSKVMVCATFRMVGRNCRSLTTRFWSASNGHYRGRLQLLHNHTEVHVEEFGSKFIPNSGISYSCGRQWNIEKEIKNFRII